MVLCRMFLVIFSEQVPSVLPKELGFVAAIAELNSSASGSFVAIAAVVVAEMH